MSIEGTVNANDTVNGALRLSERQIFVQRTNLLSICRFSVKSLIDRFCFDTVTDEQEELVNFFAVIEQILLHRLKPLKTWYGLEEPRHYWDYIRTACKKVPHSCVKCIESLENIKSIRGKGRAWLRVALMEKRLAEYFSKATQQVKITRHFYEDGAIMLSEDATVLCGMLVGLNAIDLSFCLKGKNLEMLGPLTIDYTPYMKFQQSRDSLYEDLQQEANNKDVNSSIMQESIDNDNTAWSVRYKHLEIKYKNVTEQKGYFEELLRLRDDQLDEAHEQKHVLMLAMKQQKLDNNYECEQLETIIIELQTQLQSAQDMQRSQQQEVSSLRSKLAQMTGAQKVMIEEHLPMQEIHVSSSTTDNVVSSHGDHCHHQLTASIGSEGSGDFAGPVNVLSQSTSGATRAEDTLKEESPSLVPLTGSLMSLRSDKASIEASTRSEEHDIINDSSILEEISERYGEDLPALEGEVSPLYADDFLDVSRHGIATEGEVRLEDYMGSRNVIEDAENIDDVPVIIVSQMDSSWNNNSHLIPLDDTTEAGNDDQEDERIIEGCDASTVVPEIIDQADLPEPTATALGQTQLNSIYYDTEADKQAQDELLSSGTDETDESYVHASNHDSDDIAAVDSPREALSTDEDYEVIAKSN